MSINTINLIPGTNLTQQVLNSAVDSAIQGYSGIALEQLENSGLNAEQMSRIRTIINTVRPNDSTVRAENLKSRILACLCTFPDAYTPIEPSDPTILIPGTTLTQQVLNQAVHSALQGKKDAAFQILENAGLSAVQIHKVTETICMERKNDSIEAFKNLKNLILVKLGIFQNADATTSALVNSNKSSTSKGLAAQSDELNQFMLFPNLPEDMMNEIFQNACATNTKGALTLALTCKYLYIKIIGSTNEQKKQSFSNCIDLKQFCPSLSILTPKDLKCLKHSMPFYNKLQVLNACNILLSKKIEGNRGLTLMVMPQNLNMDRLCTRARKQGMEVEIDQRLDYTLPGHTPSYCNPVEQTYLVLIANDVYEGSGGEMANNGEWITKSYSSHCEFIEEIGCDFPTLEELLALHIFKPELHTKEGEGTFWKCSRTFNSLTCRSAGRSWGIEHFIRSNSKENTIYVCARHLALYVNPAAQGAIRFLPPKK